jgi:excinuclease UvrABC helicase subunit UvrB
MLLTVKRGQQISREAVLGRLVDMLYERNDTNFSRGKFRVRGDVVEVYPATADEEAIRLEFFGDEIDAVTRFDPLTGHAHEALSLITFYPDMLYERNDMNFSRGKFRVRGDVVEVYPATADEEAIRLEFFGDETRSAAQNCTAACRKKRSPLVRFSTSSSCCHFTVMP